jgi:hypothetical protein
MKTRLYQGPGKTALEESPIPDVATASLIHRGSFNSDEMMHRQLLD